VIISGDKADMSVELQVKFEELTWLERHRVAQSHTDKSEWARCQGRDLDRYVNIHPWDKNRVKLRVPDGMNDYINASPVVLKSLKTGNQSKYIAMQGPKAGSTDHVWRMIWDELASPAVIVMLTETHEAGQEKCYQYFPKAKEDEPLSVNEEDEFGDGFKATVHCEEVETTCQGDVIEVRKLVMKRDGAEEEKIIWHLLYTEWPDFGVPSAENLHGFFALMALSKEKNGGTDNPRIIHCSAGVGRSGTFIALEHLMGELHAGAWEGKKDDDESDDDVIFNTVNALRMQRRMMVQADIQYHFIYQVIKKLWEEKYSPLTTITTNPTKEKTPSAVETAEEASG
jgi:protein-tyrosine phosphatase